MKGRLVGGGDSITGPDAGAADRASMKGRLVEGGDLAVIGVGGHAPRRCLDEGPPG